MVGDAGEQLALIPTATEGLDELHRGDQTLSVEERAGALRGQRFAIRIDDFEIAGGARPVTVVRKLGRPT